MSEREYMVRVAWLAAALGAGATVMTGSPAAGVGSIFLTVVMGLAQRHRAPSLLRSRQTTHLHAGGTLGTRAIKAPTVPLEVQQRWAHARRRLPEQFPAEPLENRNLVEVSHLYLHEPAEELERVTAEYRSVRARFLRWLEETAAVEWGTYAGDGTATGVDTVAERVQHLNDVLTAIERYLVDLHEQAEGARTLGIQVMEICAEADRLLGAARSTLGGLGGADALPEEAAQVGEAEERLCEARAVMLPGSERPVTAMRLATAARARATAAHEAVARVAARPQTLERRLAEFASAAGRAAQATDEAAAALAMVREQYARSTWAELEGADAAAARAMQRATGLAANAARRRGEGGGPAALGEAEKDLELAFAALDEASAQTGAIMARLRTLEAAAAGARQAVAGAEAAIDGALARVKVMAPEAGVAGREDLLARAGELVTRARAELGRTQPDWLSVVHGAERARELAEQAGAVGASAGEHAAALQPLLELGRSRAKSARDQVQALMLAVTPGEVGAAAYQAVSQAEKAYQQAVELERTLTEQAGGELHPVAVQGLLDTYRDAEQQAQAAATQVRSDLEPAVVVQQPTAPASLFGGVAWFGAGLLDDIDF